MTHVKTAQGKRNYIKRKIKTIKGQKLNMLYRTIENWKGDDKK